MTVAFDQRAIQEMKSAFYFDDFKYNGTAICEMRVEELPPQIARRYIASFHYSHTFPDSTLYSYGGFLGNTLCGVVCYGMGANKGQYTSLIPDIKNGEYVELTRLWCVNECPRNTESKLISESLKRLPKEIKLVVSFADDSIGHLGTIYQATNFYYCGMYRGGGTTLVSEDGLKKHGRLLGIYRQRHPEYRNIPNAELMGLLGYTAEKAGAKHRYVYIRGTKKERKQMYECIKDRILPYPKGKAKDDKKSDIEMIVVVDEAKQIRLEL